MLGDSLDGAAKTTCEYNRFGKVVKMVDPRSNALPADDPLYLVETCVYDAVGRLVSKTDRNKNTTVYAYDALDRVLSETVTVDGVPESISHSYTKTNQKLSDSNGMLAVTYRYDARGRLVEQVESDGVVKSLAYDAAGNRTGFTLTRNGTAEISLGYAYDSLNRLAEVKKGEAVIARYATTTTATGSRWNTRERPHDGVYLQFREPCDLARQQARRHRRVLLQVYLLSRRQPEEQNRGGRQGDGLRL